MGENHGVRCVIRTGLTLVTPTFIFNNQKRILQALKTSFMGVHILEHSIQLRIYWNLSQPCLRVTWCLKDFVSYKISLLKTFVNSADGMHPERKSVASKIISRKRVRTSFIPACPSTKPFSGRGLGFHWSTERISSDMASEDVTGHVRGDGWMKGLDRRSTGKNFTRVRPQNRPNPSAEMPRN